MNKLNSLSKQLVVDSLSKVMLGEVGKSSDEVDSLVSIFEINQEKYPTTIRRINYYAQLVSDTIYFNNRGTGEMVDYIFKGTAFLIQKELENLKLNQELLVTN